jgi:uncharacterized protein YhbP (UPF0306 family)
MTEARKAKPPLPLTLFDNLKDAALTFVFDEKESAIIITTTKEGTRPIKYTITKPTVEKLHRWLRSTITHM